MPPVSETLLERGKIVRPPPAVRVRKIAELLHESPDMWIALAGRMPDDLKEIIKKEPEAMPALLRAAKGLTADELKKLTEQLKRQSLKDKN